MSTLQIDLLGGFDVRSNEQVSITLPTRKARALLAIVSMSAGMKASREMLAGMLWERSAEEQARATLRQTLSSVRKALAEHANGAVFTDGDDVCLDPERCRVDAVLFETLVARESREALERANALYRGDFLASLSLREESFMNWLDGERYRLQEVARRGLGVFLENLLAGGEYDQAADVASRLLAMDPLQEYVHRALMTIHGKRGHRASALRQFETCKELLQRELQIDPEEATRMLAEEIRLQDSQAGSVQSRPEKPTASADAPEPPGQFESTTSADSQMLIVGDIRPVTVLLAGLNLDEGDHCADVERHHQKMKGFVESVAPIVSRYGGHMEKELGDNVMVTFGAPRAFGNDPERALRAAMDISSRAAEIGPVQIGVAMGQAVADGSGSGYALTGDTIKVVQRLESIAPAGGVFASESVCREAERFVEHSNVAGVHVTSRGRELPVHRVESIRDYPVWVRPTRFVGRTGELKQMEMVLNACTDGGYGQVAFVRGEPGIGKTRLMEEIGAQAKSLGFRCHKTLLFDFGTGKDDDVSRALSRSLLDIRQEHDTEQRARVAEKSIEEGWVSSERRVFLHDLLDIPFSNELRSLYDAMDNSVRNLGKQAVLAGLVLRAASRDPVLIIVEDVHWADAMVLNYLAAVAKAVRECRCVMLVTSRVEGDPLDRHWRPSIRETPFLTLDVGPLRREDAEMLAYEIGAESEQVVEHCLQRAEGNPLFLEQLLKMSGEQSTLESVPGTVQELALARSDQLPPRDKAALQAASVLGQRFSMDALSHLVREPGYDCRVLIENDLVRPEEGDLFFAHALIRDGIYTSLLPSNRRELHQAAASWFDEREPILVARHLDAAEDPKAAEAYLNAASRESDNYRSTSALELIERGLDIASTAADRFALLRLEGEIKQVVGPLSESIAALRAAVEMAPDEASRCVAMTSLAVGLRQQSDFKQAASILDEAEPIAERNDLLAELSRIHITRANLAFRLGRIEECLPHHRRALRYAQQAGSKELAVYALGGIGDANYAMGRMQTAQKYVRQCVDEAREHGLGRIESAHRALGLSYWMLDFEAYENESLESAEVAAQVGSQLSEMQAYLNMSQNAVARGDLTRAAETGERALALAETMGADRFKARSLHFLARAHLAMGKRETAIKELEQALALSRDTGAAYCGPAVLATLAMATADKADRQRLLDEGNELLDQGAVAHNFMEFYRTAIEICRLDGDWDGMEMYCGRLEIFFAAEPLPLTEHLVRRGRSLSAYGRGRRNAGLKREMEELRQEAVRTGFQESLSALEACLRDWRGA